MVLQKISVSCIASCNIPLITNEINEEESKSYNNSFNHKANEILINEMKYYCT